MELHSISAADVKDFLIGELISVSAKLKTEETSRNKSLNN